MWLPQSPVNPKPCGTFSWPTSKSFLPFSSRQSLSCCLSCVAKRSTPKPHGPLLFTPAKLHVSLPSSPKPRSRPSSPSEPRDPLSCPSSYKGPSHGLGPSLIQHDLILTRLLLQRPSFRVRLHSPVPGVRTSSSPFGGGRQPWGTGLL